ncbi:MAG: hypothetical protein JSU86_14020 [Phycisphaerales bacterium]|nr:MAG: hypothetical protein JSU86_14020 [Phycisphaerales bacterium]
MSEPQSEPLEQLSSAGLARCEVMLGELVEVMTRTHRARLVRRRLLATGGGACLVLLLIRLALPGASDPGDPARIAESLTGSSTVVQPAEAPPRPASITVIVETDASVLERCRAEPTQRVVRMDDSMLLETLASIKRPAGLIRYGGQTRLSAPVTDAELGIGQ